MADTRFTILILDDDEGDRKNISRLLRSSGLECDILLAASTRVAISLADASAPDFAFVDFGLPGESGIDAITELRSRCPGLPVAVITGQGDEDIAVASMKAGALDYVSKRAITGEAVRRMVENGMEFAALERRLAQSRQDLERFSHVLVHDLKAPLNAMAFYATCTIEDLSPDDPAGPAIDNARHVRDYAERMSSLINSLATHIRVDGKIAPVDADLDDLISQACGNLAIEMMRREAVLDMRTPRFRVSCTPPEIIQLLQNILANAIKYCPDRPPEIVISATARDGMCQVSVRDNGLGIPGDKAQEVFNPFTRLHANDEIAGTGLGLATCRKIVLRHGGRIWCESAERRGTVFHFTLPLAESETARASVPARRAGGLV
ncbi:MAG: sensor histidine kinase [Roseovarius sp.]